MNGFKPIFILAVALVLGLQWCDVAQAQFTFTTTNNIPIGQGVPGGATTATLRMPTPNPNTRIGITSDTTQDCTELAARGFVTLCFRDLHSSGEWGYEQTAPYIAASILYLKNQVGVQKVIIANHSDGAPPTWFYANISINGPAACAGPEKIIPCVTDNIQNLPAPDGVLIRDPHLNDSWIFSKVDPAWLTNSCPSARDTSVDQWSTVNGYNLTTHSATYTETFKKRLFTAQAIRNQDLLSQALSLLQQRRIQTGNPNDLGDGVVFNVVGGQSGRPWVQDVSLLHQTKNPVLVLAHDDTRPIQIATSVRLPAGEDSQGLNCTQSTFQTDVHQWLGRDALRVNGRYALTANDILGVDWESSAGSSISNAKGVTKPLMIIAHGAHYFIVGAEKMYQNATSTNDKTFAVLEGAVHGGGACTACATAQGLPANYYGDTVKREFDFIAEWLTGNGPNGLSRF